MIPVTKPFLPPKEEVYELLNGVWERNWLTNDGPLVKQYEQELKESLGVSNLSLVTNGTIALQLAIKALNLSGEIITTPFSYVATTSSIVWESCKPVFVDIDKKTLNIDATKIEKEITSKTQAILATHCFGNPCDIDAIDKIAKRYNLKVIYDASHCFGTTYKGKPVFEYGDISTLSLHATKLIHSVEGGVVFSNDPNLTKRINLMRNFGHDGFFKFNGLGINGKNSEFHAAMGIIVLRYAKEILETRKEQTLFYLNQLKKGKVNFQEKEKLACVNNSYFPILLESNAQLKLIEKELNKNGVSPRRYFYPSLTLLPYVAKKVCEVSDDVGERILCLPIYHELKKQEQKMISEIVNSCL